MKINSIIKNTFLVFFSFIALAVAGYVTFNLAGKHNEQSRDPNLNQALTNSVNNSVVNSDPVQDKNMIYIATLEPDKTVSIFPSYHMAIVSIDPATYSKNTIAEVPRSNSFGYYNGKIYSIQNPDGNYQGDVTAYDLGTKTTTTLPTSAKVHQFVMDKNKLIYLSGDCTSSSGCAAIGACGDSSPCALHMLKIDTGEDSILIPHLEQTFHDLDLQSFSLINFSAGSNILRLENGYGGEGYYDDFIYDMDLVNLKTKLIGEYNTDNSQCGKSCSQSIKQKETEFNSIIFSRVCGDIKLQFNFGGTYTLSSISDPAKKINFDSQTFILACPNK